MRFDILTIFPHMFDSYLTESLLKRAQRNGLIKVVVHNLRDYTTDRHKAVDDTPYGGGPGMVFKIEPITRAVQSLKSKVKSQKSKLQVKNKKGKTRVILFSTKGKQFDAPMAKRLSKYDQLILICGRYEGVDERVAQYIAEEEISIGPYVLNGGEVAALVFLEAVARHIPGVLGKRESLEEMRYGFGVPVYTRPEILVWAGKKLRVPEVLLSGDHKNIEEFRQKHAMVLSREPKHTWAITRDRRRRSSG